MARIESAISIRQPYVELILRGEKRFEYRSVSTKKRERVYLYAAKAPARDAAAWKNVRKTAGALQVGAIVGSVQIVDCEWSAQHKCYAYSLKAPRRLARPRRAKNAPQPVFWIPRFK